MKNNNIDKNLKLFAMQNLLLENDLARLEESGIELEHIRSIRKDDLVDVELFDGDILKDAKRMADFYVLFYSLENTIRRLIKERLYDAHGANWWEIAIPAQVKNAVKDKQDQEKDTVLAIRSEDPLSYTNFGELIVIFEAQWDNFSDTIRSKKAMKQTLSQFNQIRNVIAHSCTLDDNDMTRMKLLIQDWLNIQT